MQSLFEGDPIWVAEAGIITPPAVKEIDNKGNITTVLCGSPSASCPAESVLPAGVLVSPLTGITSAES